MTAKKICLANAFLVLFVAAVCAPVCAPGFMTDAYADSRKSTTGMSYWDLPVNRKCNACQNQSEELTVYIIQENESDYKDSMSLRSSEKYNSQLYGDIDIRGQRDYRNESLDWYIGAKFIQNFAWFTETRYTDHTFTGTGFDKQSHSAASQQGLAAFAGYKFEERWRAELEIGYLGKYSDYGKGVEFSLRGPYAHIGINYNTVEKSWGWLYFGAGLGAAFPRTTITGNNVFLNGGENAEHTSPLGALMLGWRIHIKDNWFFDLGYKFMGYWGPEHTREFVCAGGPCGVPDSIHDFTDDLGFISNHSLTLGLAWEF